MSRKNACSVCLVNCFRLHGAEEEGENGNGCLRCDLREAKEEDLVAHAQVDRHPSFLKNITESTMSTLKLPLSFVADHTERLGDSVILEGPGKEQWRVELHRSGPSITFGQGWAQFVADHVLQIGDQLYFCLSAKSYFQVEVYDGFGVQKRSALDAINSSLGLGNVKKVERKDPLRVDDAPIARREAHDQLEKGPQPAHHSLIDLGQSSELESRMSAPENVMDVAEPDRPEVSGRPAVEFAEIDKGGHFLPPLQLFCGKVVSQRRPVTDLEKAQALEGARALELVKPNTLTVMCKGHVYQGFWLAIPKQFAKVWLPSESKEITLLNKSGHKWPVKWLVPQGGLSAGWRRFTLDHRLEEYDVCVLELVDEAKHTLLVHIFRVLGGGDEDPGLYTSASTPLRRCEGRRNNRKFFPAVSNGDKARCTPQKIQEAVNKVNEKSTRKSSSGTKILKRKFCPPENDEASGSLAKARRVENGQDHRNVGKLVNLVDEEFDKGLGNEVALGNAFELRASGDAESNEAAAPQVLRASLADLVKLGKNLLTQRGVADRITAQAGAADEVHEQILNFADMPKLTGDLHTPPINEAYEGRKKDQGQLYTVVHIYRGRSEGHNTIYLTEIEGYTERSSATILDRDDDTGFWWVPSDLFEWDMQHCRIE